MQQITFFYREGTDIEQILNTNESVEIESVSISEQDSPEDLREYLETMDSEYFFIQDPDYVYASDFLLQLENSLLEFPETDIAITAHRFADTEYHLIAPPYRDFGQGLYGHIYSGKSVFATMDRTNINIVGSAGCCMFRRTVLKQISPQELLGLILYPYSKDILRKLFEKANARYVDTILAARVARKDTESNLFISYQEWEHTKPRSGIQKGKIKKEITFIYTDMGEYYNVLPIAQEAEKRGYKTSFTENLKQPCEIGVYCQHECYPENAKFSVILLHDLMQDFNHWPNLWEMEPWNHFDLGILPGKAWVDRWKKCGALYYANPRYGVFPFGYPKSDMLNTQTFKNSVEKLRKKLGLKYEHTVLYAPSYEENGSEDDFVRALSSMKVNLVVKQAHWYAGYSQYIKNIDEMRKMHEGKFDNLYYAEPEENIMTVLGLCDLVVSDESNVMIEALAFRIPSIAVTDWIPAYKQPFPTGYTFRCKKADLHKEVEDYFEGNLREKELLKLSDEMFGNCGNVCTDIMDAIDYYIGYGNKTEFIMKKLLPIYKPFN